MKKFKESCEDIIWSDDGVSDTSSTYCSLAKRYHMPIDRVKKQFKYYLENANAQMAFYIQSQFNSCLELTLQA